MLPIGRFVVISLMVFLMKISYSQVKQDSILINLPVCEVIDQRTSIYAPGQNIVFIDKKYLEIKPNQSLTDILAANTGLFLRTYGSNGPSSVSSRGSNSNHTAILWNGFNIQDPLNGGVNIGLVPSYLTDEIEIVSGGISALYGSGAIGGLIQLSSGAKFDDKFGIDIFNSIGSFSNSSKGVSVYYSSKKYAGRVKIFLSDGKNNFPYINTHEYGKPIKIQTHAKALLNGFSQENTFRFKKNQTIQSFIYYQESSREIPPTMTQHISNRKQYDKTVRVAADYNFKMKEIKFVVRSAILASEMNYEDIDLEMNSKHGSISLINEIESKLRLGKENDQLNFGINHTFEKGFSSDLDENCIRNRTAFFGAIKKELNIKNTISFNIREEIVDGSLSVPTYGIFLQHKSATKLKLSSSVTRNYRIPTFNELFWKDNMASGNRNLKSEASYTEEIGLEYNISKEKSNLIRISVFNSSITNMIQWLPLDGIWTPQNQQSVWSRGIETRIHYTYKYKKFQIKGNAVYNLVKSTLEGKNESVYNHKQLVFTPQHTALFSITFIYDFLQYELNRNFVGKRYLSYLPNEILPSYCIDNMGIYFRKEYKKNLLIIGFRVNNAANIGYEVMPTYANPGRNFELTFRYKFNIKNEINE